MWGECVSPASLESLAWEQGPPRDWKEEIVESRSDPKNWWEPLINLWGFLQSREGKYLICVIFWGFHRGKNPHENPQPIFEIIFIVDPHDHVPSWRVGLLFIQILDPGGSAALCVWLGRTGFRASVGVLRGSRICVRRPLAYMMDNIFTIFQLICSYYIRTRMMLLVGGNGGCWV